MSHRHPQGTISLTAMRPHSEESERAVLAAILLAPNTLPLISGRLMAEDFYLERHQLIYSAMLELLESEIQVDLRTLQATLKRQGKFDSVGGLAYLAGLDLDLPDLGRVDNYVEIIKKCSVRRHLISVCQEITRDCLDGSGMDADEALAKAEGLILDLGQESTQKGFVSLSEACNLADAVIEQRQGGLVGLPTGFLDWDRKTQGLNPGNLIVIAGRPGMGKTSFAVNVAQHVAISLEKPTALFSLEMEEKEIAMRILASESGLDFGRLRSGDLSQNEWGYYSETFNRTQGAPLFIDDSPNPSPLEIASKTRRLRAEHGLSLLIVDYLQLMQAGRRYENRNLEVTAMTRSFKQLAKELEIPVILLSQLSRKPEERKNHRPMLSDLRESGSIEQDADVVCFLYRDEVYNKEDDTNRGLAELIMAKHRNGETGTIQLVFDGPSTTFKNTSFRDSAA